MRSSSPPGKASVADAGGLLQRGRYATVRVEPGGAIVRKTFSGGPQAELLRWAEREFDRLERFAPALASTPGVRCPRPVEFIEGANPVIRMERVPGVPLLTWLRRRPISRDTRSRLASSMAYGLRAYVEIFDEPYYDFQMDNMIYEEGTQTLAIVDLGIPDGRASSYGVSPHEASLGNLVASTIFQSARPRWIVHRRQHREACALCADVVMAVLRSDRPAVTAERVETSARAIYRELAFGAPVSRRVWYASLGYLMARRIRTDEATFYPSHRWPV